VVGQKVLPASTAPLADKCVAATCDIRDTVFYIAAVEYVPAFSD
jgi:hypothetical protein